MKSRIVVLGAGFGGLELSTLLSQSLGDSIEVTLIDKSESFLFGYSKLDVMFGRATLESLRLPYRHFVKPGVRFVRQTITAIDPDKRRITTDSGTYDADFLIVALGADYDMAATPGLAEVNEFYSVDGAARLRDVLPGFKKGKALIGVCGAPFKCLRRRVNARCCCTIISLRGVSAMRVRSASCCRWEARCRPRRKCRALW